MDLNFTVLLAIIFFTGAGFIRLIRNIQFFSLDTDNEKQVYAASRLKDCKWPSDIHKLGIGKTYMKDVTIFLLALFQKIFRDNKSDSPLVGLSGLSNCISAVLIFLIARNYWGSDVGLLLSILYIVSIWPWQVALFGGHINIATMFFLTTILSVQTINFSAPVPWLLISGFILCLTMFASASATKYILPFFAAVFYESYKPILLAGSYGQLMNELLVPFKIKISLMILVLLAISFMAARLSYKKIVTSMYAEKSFGFLNNKIEARATFPLDHYLRHASKKINSYAKIASATALFLFLIFNMINFSYLLPILGGFLVSLVLLTVPDIKKGIKNYLSYFLGPMLGQGGMKYHFKIYVDFFAKRGIRVNRTTRGAGPKWVPLILLRMAPFHLIIFLVSVLLAFILLNTNSISVFLILAASLLPIIWSEITGAAQIGRTYSPALIGMLIFIGYTAHSIQLTYGMEIYWLLFWVSVIPAATWNIYIFSSDIYPARMAIPNLIVILRKLGIKEFYTYQTNYNNALTNAINPGVAKQFTIRYMNNLEELKNKNAWIIIPGTSSKAINMESEMEGIDNGDFAKDPLLNKLIETREIENIAEKRLKTFGTSRYWVHESEVTSYRDLILHDVRKEDIFRGYAWLLNADKIK